MTLKLIPCLGWRVREVLIEAGAIPVMTSYRPGSFQDAASYITRHSVDNMAGTIADDAKAAKDQINQLAKNLGTLNQIYGNMLSAMQGR